MLVFLTSSQVLAERLQNRIEVFVHTDAMYFDNFQAKESASTD